ncbi:hypothetical protein ACFYUY_26410 [Kitasatospora sp. NPDC004745]|uniref:hypothetical protein n=1 Tax=Kitasatospora sp. NPDC004745 TaxID=3364019 RepID=UPI0036B2631A
MNTHAHPFVGDFRELERGRPDGPSLRDAVRAEVPEYERELLAYLEGGSVLFASPSAVPDVLGDPGAVIGGLHLCTDGTWLRYSDLAHDVRHYHVALDPAFLAHARGNGWTAPALDDDALDAMLTALFGDEAG